MYKRLWIYPGKGTGLHKLTNKKDYSIQRTRDDSLVLRHHFCHAPYSQSPFCSQYHLFWIHVILPYASNHPKVRIHCSYHLLPWKSFCVLQPHEWWARKRKLACYDHPMKKSDPVHWYILLQHIMNIHSWVGSFTNVSAVPCSLMLHHAVQRP